jgi:hypothetical protein
MTEHEWLTATDPLVMLRYVENKVSPRKRRLFACHCCRLVWNDLSEICRAAVETAEKFADDLRNRVALATAWQQANIQAMKLYAPPSSNRAYYASALAEIAADNDRASLARDAYSFLLELMEPHRLVRRQSRTAARVRDVVGNPFSVALDLHHLPLFSAGFTSLWLSSTVTSLAQAIYDDRQLPSGLFDNQRMGVLADALEEAGCDNADILGHLRGGGEHVRGCWAIDLLLGKE